MAIEDLIGKNIIDVPYNFTELNSDNGSTTYFASDLNCTFFSKPVKISVVSTDSNKNIETVSTDFKEVMDSEFYQLLVEKYGIPNSVLKSKVIVNEESKILPDGVNVKSKSGTLEECKFEDHPLFIRWDKPKFRMIFTLQYELNRTELTIQRTPDTLNSHK